jgi:hypothetical protein
LFREQGDYERFKLMCMAGFLHDTFYVENQLVNPVCANVHRLSFKVPDKLKGDMAIVLKEEAQHAIVSLDLVQRMEKLGGFQVFEPGFEEPLFIRNIELLLESMVNDKDVYDFRATMACVTETRISRELGVYAKDKKLNDVVKTVCQEHQDDEKFHDSLFRALAHIAWEQADKGQREKISMWYAKGMIARSAPDVQRMAFYLEQTTGWAREKCDRHAEKIFSKQFVKDEIIYAAKPTLSLLRKIGVLNDTKVYRLLTEFGFFD